jgi:hypothetical protein
MSDASLFAVAIEAVYVVICQVGIAGRQSLAHLIRFMAI